ncbi:MAG: DUF3095 family protein [Bradymonadia bacterium]
MNSSLDYLESLPTVTEFPDLFSEDEGINIPPDWLVIATDIMGSTKAIEAGKYKEVNTLGAASIIHLINACKPHRIAYQFGGDGSLISVPSQCREAVLSALSHLKLTAEKQFSLTLRIGVWTVEEFAKHGYELALKKYCLVDKQVMFMFVGDGVAVSDEWLKSGAPVDSLPLPKVSQHNTALSDGLECRWNPLRAHNGTILTGIILATGEDKVALLKQAHAKLEDTDPYDTRPATLDSVRPAYPPKHYYTEWRIRTAGQPFLMRWFTFIAVHLKIILLLPIALLLKKKIPYFQELVLRSDFQKYDGVYRFVRDLTPEQAKQFRNWCETQYKNGDLIFGLTESPTALMTCLLLDDDEHIHFIDGGNGGYAMAAKEFKHQLNARE